MCLSFFLEGGHLLAILPRMLHSHCPQPQLVPHAAECWSSNLAGQAVASDVHAGEIAENVSLDVICVSFSYMYGNK